MTAEYYNMAIGHYNYYVAIILMMAGFYVVIVANNLVKKLIGLTIFQTSVLLLYISVGKVEGAVAPILRETPGILYSNPLPHVLMLTAIVVGIATIAVGLALVVRIHDAYGTIDEDKIVAADNRLEKRQLTPGQPVPPDPLLESETMAKARRKRMEKLASLFRGES